MLARCICWISANSPLTEGPADEERDRGLKKSKSNKVESSGSVEAGLGIWKAWSKLNHRGTAGTERGSDTVCNRLPSIPLGRLDQGRSESPSDKRLFLGRDGRISVHRGETVSICEGEGGGDWVLNGCQWCRIRGLRRTNLLRFNEG